MTKLPEVFPFLLACFLCSLYFSLATAKCPSLSLQPRIVGGNLVPKTSVLVPHMVSYSVPKRSGTGLCSGILVAPNWVLTAAHCFNKATRAPASVSVGGIYKLRGDTYPVSRVLVHPKYDASSWANDAAMIELKEPVKRKGYILLSSKELPDTGSGRAIGYGTTASGAKDSGYLRAVDVPIVSITKCKSMLRNGEFTTSTQQRTARFIRRILNKELHMCAGYEDGGCDSCQGDSGGPLLMVNGEGKYFVAGLVSFGLGCGFPSAPGVYARVSTLFPWIRSVASRGALLRADIL